jgi:hypothetical protein
MGEGREDEMKEVRASEAEETERPKAPKPHRKKRRRKGGGSEREEESGKGRQGGHKGTHSEGLKRSLADADGVYLQTDGFRFR